MREPIITIEGRVTHAKWASLTDALQACREASSEIRYNVDSQFGFRETHSKDLADAVNIASHTWKDGTDRLKSAIGRIHVSGRQKKQEIAFDVVGDTWDMGRVINGEPECAMLWQDTDEDKVGDGQIVRVVVNVSMQASVSTETIYNRGAATIGLIDALESAGRRVELVMARINDGYDGNTTFTEVPLKQADEPLQLDKLAFCLCHPSINRRIGFALTWFAGEAGKNLARSGYGSSSAYVPPCDIYLKRLDYDGEFDNPDRWIRKNLTALGVEFEND